MAGPSTCDIFDLVTKLTSLEIKSKAPSASKLIQIPRGYDVAAHVEPKPLLRMKDRLEKQFGNFIVSGQTIGYGFQAEMLLIKGAIDLLDCQPSNLLGEVHPVFQRDNFDDCSDGVYDQLLPGLRLATKLISTSPLLQHWMTTLYGERKQTLDPEGVFYRERISEEVPLNPDNITKFVKASQTWSKLFHINFVPQLNDQSSNEYSPCCGYTHPIFEYNKDQSIPCNRPLEDLLSATRSRIKMHGDFYIAACKFGAMRYPNNSQKLRFNLMFAITLVHELAHAVENTFKDQRSPYEVFMGNNLESEAGMSWETSVFGGTVTSINGRMDCSMGLAVTDWPYAHAGGHTIGMAPAIISSVPMDYIAAIQQEGFWAEKVNCSTALYIPRNRSAYSLAIPYTSTIPQDLDPRENWIERKVRYLQEPHEPATKRRKLRYDGISAIEAHQFKSTTHVRRHKSREREDDDYISDDDMSYFDDEFILRNKSTSAASFWNPLACSGRLYPAPGTRGRHRRDRHGSSNRTPLEQKMRREKRLAKKARQKSMREMGLALQGLTLWVQTA